jgi:DNA-binding NtrC family response regulator
MTPEFPGIAHSQALQQVLAQARIFAGVPRPVLVRGERGTGKELVARFIHRNSRRADAAFVVMNCAALNDELVNAEIYGHEKGAFTGAHESRAGKLEQADGGTLFMDEIGNMSMPFQERILRVVEYQEFQRVRGTETIKVDVRMISATNADLEELMDDGLFRSDLYDRLTFATLRLPPLRDRREDVPHLIVHFVRSLHEEIPNLMQRTFERATVEAMVDYYWPGNVRELKNIVERLYLYGSSERITPADLPRELTGAAAGPAGAVGGGFHEQVEAFKQQLICDALARAHDNQRAAADDLQMSYDQFRHFYRKYGCGARD